MRGQQGGQSERRGGGERAGGRERGEGGRGGKGEREREREREREGGWREGRSGWGQGGLPSLLPSLQVMVLQMLIARLPSFRSTPMSVHVLRPPSHPPTH